MTRDHRFAIYSLEEKRMIVPLVYDYIYYDSRTFRFHLSRDGIVFSPYKWEIVDYMTP